MSMPGTLEEAKIPATPSLPLYQADVKSFAERATAWRPQVEGAVPVQDPRYVFLLARSVACLA